MTYPDLHSPERAEADGAYRLACVQDELTIARLLGWGNLPSVEAMVRSSYNTATHGKHDGYESRVNTKVLPRWRRDWSGAGELISRCGLSIHYDIDGIIVRAGEAARASHFSNHPDKDSAIRRAMCEVAIMVLTAEREPP